MTNTAPLATSAVVSVMSAAVVSLLLLILLRPSPGTACLHRCHSFGSHFSGGRGCSCGE